MTSQERFIWSEYVDCRKTSKKNARYYSRDYFFIAADGSRGGERVVMDIEKRGGRQFVYSGHTDSHDYDSLRRPADPRPRPDNRFPTELINTRKKKTDDKDKNE